MDRSQVLGGQEASALDSTTPAEAEQLIEPAVAFAPEVFSVLHNVCQDIVRNHLDPKALAKNYGGVENFNKPATRALTAIRE